MGREVRRVPADWVHPYDYARKYHRPLLAANFSERHAEWVEEKAKWEAGFAKSYADGEDWRPRADDELGMSFEEWSGPEPQREDYMPEWPAEQRTHLQMYENTTEGTPIGPVMETPEELARWLADNGASSFGSMTATYEQWLSVCRGAWAPSMVITSAGAVSGVEFAGEQS